MSDDLPFTGERFVPGTRGEIWIEHWHRYHFASRWVAGKRVLDVACGEGYGSALLARHAAHVTGVDLSADAIAHAMRAYATVANVAFVAAPCTALPIPDASIDVAVSFETLEHIAAQEAFLDEIARVLVPGGVLILSCPNKLEYTDRREFRNPFHVKELYRDELAKLVGERFPESAWYGQRPTFFSLIAPEAAGEGRVEAQLVEVSESQPGQATAHLQSPLYFIVVAGRRRESVEALAGALSVLADRDDWVHRDYEHVMQDLDAWAAKGRALEKQVGERDRDIAALQSELHLREKNLEMQVAARDAALATSRMHLEERERALAEKDREIDRRRGWRWWLKLPLVRLGLLK